MENNRLNLLVQFSHSSVHDLPNVPTILDLATTELQRNVFRFISADTEMGMPFLAPPGAPQEVVAALRKAFQDTMVDPAFVEACKKAGIEIEPISPEQTGRVVSDILGASPETIALAKQWSAVAP